ncbi:MAG: hypothetical protein AAFW98_04070 [Pseudomonadota bacterium]
MLTLEDNPPHAGARFAALAVLAGALGAREAIVPTIEAKAPEPDHQHVTSHGRLVANGIVHLERAGVRVRVDPASPGTLVGLSTTSPLEAVAATCWSSNSAVLLDRDGRSLAVLRIDSAGRPYLNAASPPPVQRVIRLAIAARPAAMRDYPAVRMALADACDHAGVAAKVDLIDPAGCWHEALDDVRGIVLPGGCDMDALEGLIAIAAATRASRLPTLGLCLGFQAMAIAVARCVPDWAEATTKEVATADEPLAFTRLHYNGRPHHRLGDEPVCLPRQLARRLNLPQSWTERMNHRYAMATPAVTIVSKSGISLARSASGVVDVLGDPRHPFWVGSEGHPELTSRPQAPHPLFAAFLHSVTARHPF